MVIQVRTRVVVMALTAMLAAGGLAGCGGDPPEPATTTPPGQPSQPATTAPTPPAPSPTEPAVALFEFEITDGRADPPLQRATVERGETVRIVVSADQPDELHLHGYDLEAAMAPGDPAVIEFVADQTGQFELETHDSHVVLLQLLVR